MENVLSNVRKNIVYDLNWLPIEMDLFRNVHRKDDVGSRLGTKHDGSDPKCTDTKLILRSLHHSSIARSLEDAKSENPTMQDAS